MTRFWRVWIVKWTTLGSRFGGDQLDDPFHLTCHWLVTNLSIWQISDECMLSLPASHTRHKIVTLTSWWQVSDKLGCQIDDANSSQTRLEACPKLVILTSCWRVSGEFSQMGRLTGHRQNDDFNSLQTRHETGQNLVELTTQTCLTDKFATS